MSPALNTSADRLQQARTTVRIALMIAFCAAVLGIFFGMALGAVSMVEIWLISLCALVIVGMLVVVSVRPAMATGVVTGTLSVYVVIHLNVVAIYGYQASEEIIAIVPYLTWFFPLVIFHQFTNFGFHKRSIGVLVSLGPVPIVAFVLGHPTVPLANQEVGAIVAFMISFFAFVIFVGHFTRHRDQEILRAGMAEEAERSTAMLRVSEERFRLLSRATNDLIWDADLKSGRIWWNDALLDNFGYDPKTFEDDMATCENLVHPEDRVRVVESLRSVIESGGSNWATEYRFLCGDGRTVDVMARGLVLRDASGAPIRVIGSTTDVSELRALEKKLRHSQKLEAVGQLTGGIAHDFNNLLTVIVGSAEALADMHTDDPKVRRMAETTLQAAERGATLTSHLLAFARRQALAPMHLDPAQLLTRIEGLVSRTINEDVDIRISAAPGVWPIEVDPGQLENAILNLVINARDAMPDGGRVTIEASNAMLMADDHLPDEEIKEGRYVMFSVTDDGCGMPLDIAERAFEPFFTTKEAGKGSGLGLSMVWGFVQQSNGHARIYSEPGDGTSVKLYFPAADKTEDQEPAPVPDAGLIRGTERILVV